MWVSLFRDGLWQQIFLVDDPFTINAVSGFGLVFTVIPTAVTCDVIHHIHPKDKICPG